MQGAHLENPTVDGIPVGFGYGILIAYEQSALGDYLPMGVTAEGSVLGPRLVAWLTKRRRDGVYEPIRELEPGSKVRSCFRDGTLEFCDGQGMLTFRVPGKPDHPQQEP